MMLWAVSITSVSASLIELRRLTVIHGGHLRGWPPYSFPVRPKKRELNVSRAWNRLDRMDLRTLCDQAARYHQSGSLEDAARLYLQVIQADRRNFFAHHMLGILRGQQGRQGEALELIAAAIRIDPYSAEAFSNYGNLLTTLGRPGEALSGI